MHLYPKRLSGYNAIRIFNDMYYVFKSKPRIWPTDPKLSVYNINELLYNNVINPLILEIVILKLESFINVIIATFNVVEL